MKKVRKGLLPLLLEALKEWLRDRSSKFAAGIAYYSFLSIVPLIIALFAASSLILGPRITQQVIEPMVEGLFHHKLVVAMKQVSASAHQESVGQVYSMTLISILSLVYGLQGYATAIKFAMEHQWGKRRVVVAIKPFIKRKATGFFIIFVIAGIALGGLLLMYVFQQAVPDKAQWLVRLICQTLMFFLAGLFYYNFIPPVSIKWKHTIPGALLTAILHMVGKYLIDNTLDTKFGNGLSVVDNLLLLLMWAYYSALVFLYASEFNRLYIQQKEHFDVHKMKIE